MPFRDNESSSEGPTLHDLLALRPSGLEVPAAIHLHAKSSKFRMYARRHASAVERIEKALNKSQLVKIAKEEIRLSDVHLRLSKRKIVHRILLEVWGLVDPETIMLAEASAAQAEAMPTVAEGEAIIDSLVQTNDSAAVLADVPVNEAELFLLLNKMGGPSGAELLRDLREQHNAKISLTGQPPDTLRVTGPQEEVKKVLSAWAETKKVRNPRQCIWSGSAV